MAAITSTNSSKISRGIVILIGVLLVVPFATGILGYYSRFGNFGSGAKAYLLLMAGLAVGVGVMRHPRPSPAILLFVLLQLLRLIEAFFRSSATYTNAWERLDVVPVQIGSIVFTIAVFCLGGSGATLRKTALIAAGLTIFLCTVANMWQWHDSDAFVKETPGRSAGWLWDANASADAIVVMMALFLAISPSAWLSAAVVAVSSCGLFCTLSRSGALVFVLTLVTYFIFVGSKSIRHILVFSILVVGFCIGGAYYFDFDYHPTQSNWVAKQDEGRKNALLGKGLSEIDLDGTDHLYLMKDAIAGIKANPVLGYGTGASGGEPFMPHNEVLAVWLDNGIAGLFIYLLAIGWLLAECWRRQPKLLVACVPILAIVPFSHSTLEDRFYTFCWVAIIGICRSSESLAPAALKKAVSLRPAPVSALHDKVGHFFQRSGTNAVENSLAKPEVKP